MATPTGILHYLESGDAVTHAVAYVLLAMSIASWCFLLVKAWVLVRAKRQGPAALAAFWRAATLDDGLAALRAADKERVFLPLAEAARDADAASRIEPHALAARVERGERVLRALRHALRASQRRLEFGQVLLASIGSTAPFVGLLGTVWGIYHALDSIAASGQAQIENVAGPVGEALIMTAFGLVVAIPAVLAYNILGRLVRQLVEELDGFARDLHVFVCGEPAAAPPTTRPPRPSPRRRSDTRSEEGGMAFGGLDHQHTSQPMADINMTPLIDVMLVLLVIFILTAPLLTHAIRLDLPKVAAAPARETPETITVSIDAAGKLYWNDAPVALDALAARLRDAAANGKDPELHLRAARDTRYDTIAQVMGAAQQAGVARIGFVTDASGKPDASAKPPARPSPPRAAQRPPQPQPPSPSPSPPAIPAPR